jgi:hypothetical protein
MAIRQFLKSCQLPELILGELNRLPPRDCHYTSLFGLSRLERLSRTTNVVYETLSTSARMKLLIVKLGEYLTVDTTLRADGVKTGGIRVRAWIWISICGKVCQEVSDSTEQRIGWLQALLSSNFWSSLPPSEFLPHFCLRLCHDPNQRHKALSASTILSSCNWVQLFTGTLD